MAIEDSYEENHVSFEIADIVWEEDYVRQVGGEAPDPDPNQLSGDEVPEGIDDIDDETANKILTDIFEERREELEEFEELVHNIEFEYEAPAISVDTSGRFTKHEIIGGATVRQKTGEDPVEVVVNGVCKEPTARRLDQLRDAKYGTIFSNRLAGGSLRVQFASTSTQPLDDGGAVPLNDEDGEFLYSYTLNCIEVII